MKPAHWWKERPRWVDALRDAPDLDWLSESTSEKLAQQMRAELLEGGGAGYGLAPEVVAASLERPVVPLARLPERSDRRGMIPYRPTLFGDPARPEQAWIGLDALTPPLLWIDAGTTPESLRAVWAPYALASLPARRELPRERRYFVGSPQQLGELEPLADALAHRPGLDTLAWGTVRDDDPWADRVDANALVMARVNDEVRRQSPAALPALTMRTVFTGSLVTLTLFEGCYTLTLRYRPCGHAALYERLNAQFGTRFPTDLPVDALMALTAFPTQMTAEDFEALLVDPNEASARIGDAVTYAALCFDDLRRLRWLVRDVLNVPGEAGADLRRAAAQIADRLDLVTELCAMLEAESDPALLEMLHDMTAMGGAA